VAGSSYRYSADQLGHRDSRFTERVYRQAAKRRERMANPHQREYDWARDWALMGTSESESLEAFDLEATKNPV